MRMWERMQIDWRPTDPGGLAQDGREPEWLVTNGLGSFASGTVLGIHRRRYHGLLIAALQPPVRRRLMWVKNDEWLVTSTGRFPLATNDYGGTIAPDGWRRLHSFRVYPFPTAVFLARGIMLERTVFMVYDQNTTVVLYRFLTGAPDVELHIDAFVNFRDYHHTTRADAIRGATGAFVQRAWPAGTAITARTGAPELFLGAGCMDHCSGPRVHFDADAAWHYNFHYALERERGLDFVEDHLRVGVFRWRPSGAGDTLAVIGHCSVPETDDTPPWGEGGASLLQWALQRYEAAVERRAALLHRAGAAEAPAGARLFDDVRARLILAADDFIVHRQTTNAATVIAGYPWFADWGRDAMISLPGLLLSTGRHEEAKEVLLTFASHRADGLIPNRFPDDGEGPLYNTVDAALWFLWAAGQYAAVTGDAPTVRRHLLPVMEDIIRHYVHGTRHGIGIDRDGLVRAGADGLALTWMDAKAGDWVVTPRVGAPVEINALWYNGLRTVATLARAYAQSDVDVAAYDSLARKVRRQFARRFASRGGGLWDVVSAGSGAGGAEVRPNQMFAAALPFAVLTRARARDVVQHVARNLLTPVGLRTLSPGDAAYVGRYGGDQRRRDGAYHQGTVWPWLLGPFVDGWRRAFGTVRGASSADPMTALFGALRAHMHTDGALGHVSEIFEGDAPFGARGCFAQAWSVAEWLRVLNEPT